MKRLFVTTLLLFLTVSAFAQKDWGIKLGLNATNLRNSAFYEYSNMEEIRFKPRQNLGFHVGFYREISICNLLSFQPEVVYSLQGNHFEETIPGISPTGSDLKLKIRNTVGYINVPLMARVYIGDFLSLDLGPQFGYAIHSKQNVQSKYASHSDKNKEKIKDYELFDVSLALGFTLVASQTVDITLRYNVGLTDFTLEEHKIKNSVLQAGVGIRF